MCVVTFAAGRICSPSWLFVMNSSRASFSILNVLPRGIDRLWWPSLGEEGITSKMPDLSDSQGDMTILSYPCLRLDWIGRPCLGPILPGDSQLKAFLRVRAMWKFFWGPQPVDPLYFFLPVLSPLDPAIASMGSSGIDGILFSLGIWPSVPLCPIESCVLVSSLWSDFLRPLTFDLDLVWAKEGQSGPNPWIAGPFLRERQLVPCKKSLPTPPSPGSLPPQPQSQSGWASLLTQWKPIKTPCQLPIAIMMLCK